MHGYLSNPLAHGRKGIDRVWLLFTGNNDETIWIVDPPSTTLD